MRSNLEVSSTAKQLGQSSALDLFQLRWSERSGLITVLEVESVTELEVVVLDTVDAGKGGTSIGAWEVALGQTTSEQINVLRDLIDLTHLVESVVRNKERQILPALDLDIETVVNIMDVAWNSVFTTTPNVSGWQVATSWQLDILVKMVVDISGDPWIDSVRSTGQQTVNHFWDQTVAQEVGTMEPFLQTVSRVLGADLLSMAVD